MAVIWVVTLAGRQSSVEDERLVALFRNRAELKKELSTLDDERHRRHGFRDVRARVPVLAAAAELGAAAAGGGRGVEHERRPREHDAARHRQHPRASAHEAARTTHVDRGEIDTARPAPQTSSHVRPFAVG